MKLKKNTKVVFVELPGTDLHRYLLIKRKGATPVELIGVTSLMGKMGLRESYEGGAIRRDVIARAASRGTAIHELFQAYEMEGSAVSQISFSWTREDGETATETEDVSKLLDKYRELSALNFKAVAVEYLVSDNESVASLIDFVSEVDGKTVDLIDYKSSNRLDKEGLAWQLSFYKYFFERQNKGIKVRHLLGVHCHDAKGLKIVPVDYKGDDAVADILYRFQNGLEGPGEEAVETTAVTLAELLPDYPNLTEKLEIRRTLLASVEHIDGEISLMLEALKGRMRDSHLTEVSVPGGKYVFTEEHTAERFNSKKFKADHPDEYEKYVTTSSVASSLKFYKNK